MKDTVLAGAVPRRTARERHRDQQTSSTTRRLTWPTIVLTGGILLSLAANLAQTQPTA